MNLVAGLVIPERAPGPDVDTPLLLTTGEAARLLGMSPSYVVKRMKAGEIRPVHLGRATRIARAELERYIAQVAAEEAALVERERMRVRRARRAS